MVDIEAYVGSLAVSDHVKVLPLSEALAEQQLSTPSSIVVPSS